MGMWEYLLYSREHVILTHGIRENKLMQATPMAHVTDGLTDGSSNQITDHLVEIHVLD